MSARSNYSNILYKDYEKAINENERLLKENKIAIN